MLAMKVLESRVSRAVSIAFQYVQFALRGRPESEQRCHAFGPLWTSWHGVRCAVLVGVWTVDDDDSYRAELNRDKFRLGRICH